MLKRIKYINEETKQVLIMSENSNLAWAVQNGYSENLYDVEQSDKDNGWYLAGYAPMYTNEELAQIEADRVSALEQTRGDVFRAVFKAFGVKREALRAMIENYEITEEFTEEDKELALIDFDEGLNFIRGNELIDAMGSQLGVSSTQMDKFFETNDYLELIKVEESEVDDE